jgi:hypothetical protein
VHESLGFHRTTCTVYCALCINFFAFSENFIALLNARCRFSPVP